MSPVKAFIKRRKREDFSTECFYLIDAILPAREVHILGGEGGVGKSRWLLELLQTWSRGEKVFGFESHPVPYVYLPLDRSYSSACETCRDLNIDPQSVPIVPVMELEKTSYTLDWIFKIALEDYPKAKLFVIEAMGTIIPGGKTNDYATVSRFLREATRLCQKHDITIWGLHHTSKPKEGEYANPREKLLGSVAWANFSSTIFCLEHYDQKDPKNPYRTMTVMPRNKTENFSIQFKRVEGGRLVKLGANEKPTKKEEKTGGRPVDERIDVAVMEFLISKKEFRTQEIVDALIGIASADTISRRLKVMVDAGTIVKLQHGIYGAKSIESGPSSPSKPQNSKPKTA